MKTKIWLRFISTISILILSCAAAFGFLGTQVLVNSLRHDESSLDGSIHWMTASADFFYQTFSSQGLASELNTSYPYYNEILQVMQETEQEAAQFKSAMDNVLTRIENILTTVKKYSSYSFYGVYGLIGLITVVSLLLIYVLHYNSLYMKIPALVLGILFMWLCWMLLSFLFILLWGSSSACHVIYLYFKTQNLDVLPSALRHFVPATNTLPSISFKEVSQLQQAVVESFQSQMVPIVTALNVSSF